MRAIVFLSLFMTFAAHADCKQANFSSDGASVSIHYSSFSKSDGNTAWVYAMPHVGLPLAKCDANRVEVAFIQGPSFHGDHGTSKTVALKRVSLRNCEYVSEAPVTVRILSHAGRPEQQIAVHIGYESGDEWLTDPINGSHNFNYKIFSGYDPANEVCL